MKKRTQSREYAIQMMYQAEMMGTTAAEITNIFWKSFDKPDENITKFAEELFTKALHKKDEHDQIIMQFLKDSWSFDRLGEMEKSVLRVAVDELLNSETPVYAVMDDYVTLTKKFTDEKIASFVNGLLENIRSTFLKEESASERAKK